MSFLIISANEFERNMPRYFAEARRQKVAIICDDGFVELTSMDPATEAQLIAGGIAALVKSGNLPVTPDDVVGDDIPLEELLRGRAT